MIIPASTAEELVWNGTPTVVCYTNPVSCAPCRALDPHLRRVADYLGNRVTFLEVNVLENMDLAVENDVQGTPTLHLITQSGRVGLTSRTAQPLLAEIEEHLHRLGA